MLFFGCLLLNTPAAFAQKNDYRKSSVTEVASASKPVTGKRVALLIGNSSYTKLKKLANPKNDVRLIEETLRNLGFTEIIGGTKSGLDLRNGDMLELLDIFSKQASGAEVAVIFFAGHGVMTKAASEQFLAGVEASAVEARLPSEALSINTIMDKLSITGAKQSFVFLDACRETARGGGLRNITLKRDAPNTVIFYATAADDVASDGKGNNSPFTAALSAEIQIPNQEWATIQRGVIDRVMTATEDQQQPRPYGSFRNPMYFKQVAKSGPKMLESEYWATVKDSKDAADLEAYLTDYPKGQFRRLAENRVKALKVATASQAAAVVPPPRPAPVPLSSTVSASTAQTLAPVVAATADPGQIIQDCSECPKMVVIPAGSFLMGSSETDGNASERPRHTVTFNQPFALGQTEVTQAQWMAIMGDKKSNFKNCGDRCPVVNVSWEEIQVYIQKLNGKTKNKYGYRLPSEAEWEYAARAGKTTAFHTGDKINPDQANFNASYTYNGSLKGSYLGRPADVASYPQNSWGLFDMHGNVWEQLYDCWSSSYTQISHRNGVAWIGGNCSQRLIRGGGWGDNPANLRSANRNRLGISERADYIGFRLARTLF